MNPTCAFARSRPFVLDRHDATWAREGEKVTGTKSGEDADSGALLNCAAEYQPVARIRAVGASFLLGQNLMDEAEETGFAIPDGAGHSQSDAGVVDWQQRGKRTRCGDVRFLYMDRPQQYHHE
jgi:hypothetical protein